MLQINDNPLALSPKFRSLNFMNVESYRKLNDAKSLYSFTEGTPERRIFKLITLAMSNGGKKFKREIKLVVDEAAQIGGIAKILTVMFAFLYNFFGKPFRELHLAIMF